MRKILLFALTCSALGLLGQDNLQGDLLPGCMDSMACNYDSLAEFDDGSCEFETCAGCTNSEATNFDSTATIDDGLCLFVDPCGQVYGDDLIVTDFTGFYAPEFWDIYTGGNGSVDITSSQIYIVGIDEDPEAFDAITEATISVVSTGTVTFSWSFTTEDMDGTGYDLGYYINGTRYDLDDSSGDLTQVGVVTIEVTQGDLLGFGVDATDGCCGGGFLTITNFTSELAECIGGCADSGACNYDSMADYDDDSCEYETCAGCTNADAENYDSTATIEDGNCWFEDLCGNLYVDGMTVNGFTAYYAPEYWDIFLGGNGTIDITNDQMYIVGVDEDPEPNSELTEATITILSTGVVSFSWNFTTEDEDGTGYDLGYYINGVRYDLDNGSGELTQVGVITIDVVQGDLLGFGVDATDGCCGGGFLTITNFMSETGDCEGGCTDSEACNYDATAGYDDESCDYETCTGCMDSAACNFDSTATIDESCDYETCAGCMDTAACNFDSTATIDESCDYETCAGCMDSAACNFDSTATIDELCDYETCAGCMDSAACNFDSTATIDELCDYETCAGCMDSEACNYDSTATIENDSCEFETCAGCLDAMACNFNSTATINDESCEYETCAGCTDNEAMNYDSASTIDDGSCLYLDPCGTISNMDGLGTDFIGHYSSSQWDLLIESDGTIEIEETYIHIIGGNAQDDEEFAIEGQGFQGGGGDFEMLTQVSRAAAATGTYTFSWSYTTEDGPEYDIAYYINGVRYDLTVVDGGLTQAGAISFDAIEGDVIGFGIDSTDDCCGVGELTITDFTYPAGDCLMGCTNADACNFDSEANFDDDSCEYESCAGCTDLAACNYDSTSTIDDDSCDFSCYGCTDTTACNFDSAATIDDASCDYLVCAGCTDTTACNFDADATIDNGECEYGSCPGCMDSTACNYDDMALVDDGSCAYGPDPGFFANEWLLFFADCEDYSDYNQNDPLTLLELNEDGLIYEFGAPVVDWSGCGVNMTVGVEDEIFGYGVLVDGTVEYIEDGTCFIFIPAVLGCTDLEACNFDPSANFGDDSCEYDSCAGCTDMEACNYDSSATIDDDSCEYDSCAGCTDMEACNYDSSATIDDDSCEYDSCAGCTDMEACNYDSSATIDGDSCEYDSCAGCTDMEACNYDSSATLDNDSCEYDSCAGCTDEEACNYDSTATLADDSCDYSCLGCTDIEACNFDSTATMNDDSCDYNSCAGCTDMEACNYDSSATIDNDSCEFDSCAGCMDMEACNYDSSATIDNDSCEFDSCAGCTDMEACNYDSSATIDDDSCEYDSCAGCTDLEACNYDSSATIDDDSCEYDSCAGCTDMQACNYDSSATIDNDSCEYDSCAGCTDMEACNYDSSVTIDDDSCEYDSCAGCTDMQACNYDSSATIDDDSCEYDSCAGCTDSEALNYDPTATIDDGSCFYDCEMPTFEFNVYCEDSDQDNFYVELTVTGTSNGFPFTVSNDVNTSTENVTATGVFNLGAFDNNEIVTFTVDSDEISCSMTSDMLTGNCMIDLVDEIDLSAMTIFPNPTNGDFTISNVLSDEQLTIEIVNALGQLVFTQKSSANDAGDFTVETLDRLAEGNYMVRVSQGNELQVIRIIVQK